MANSESTRQLLDTYRSLAATESAGSLYRIARADGATKIEAMILLRDLYNFGLIECERIANEAEAKK
jgi:hypothetical protein